MILLFKKCVSGVREFMQCIFFYYNILQDASITELFQVSLVVSRTLGEGAIVQMFYWYAREKCVCGGGGVISAWWHVMTALRHALRDQWQKVSVYGDCVQFPYLWDWTSRSKKLWGTLKSHQLGVVMQVRKLGLFSQGRQVLTI